MVRAEAAAAASASSLYDLWHKRLGHIGRERLLALVKQELITLPASAVASFRFLSALSVLMAARNAPLFRLCLPLRVARSPHPRADDLHGPLPYPSNKFRYWIPFVNDASRFRSVYLLHSKDGAFDAFKLYRAWAEKQTGASIKLLRDDKGTSLTHGMSTWLRMRASAHDARNTSAERCR